MQKVASRLTRPFGVDLAETVYALDATTIDLCLAVFPWAPFRRAKAAIKLHTFLDLRGNIPSFIHISDGKMHKVNVLDQLIPEAGAYYVMDRGYLDCERLHRLHEAGSFFVTRAKSNLKAERRFSHPVDRTTGVICDQTIMLSVYYSHQGFPELLRRIKYRDPKTGKRLVFLTNNFTLPPLSIADLYRCRWQVELFKWLKQHLRIKACFGTSENAVKTQIWIAVSVYVLVAIVKNASLCPQASMKTYRSSASHSSSEPLWISRLRIARLISMRPHLVTKCIYSTNVGTLLKSNSNDNWAARYLSEAINSVSKLICSALDAC